MSEPNDTAQEGFDQLKRNLEVRYPEDSDLSLDEFLNVESLLALAVRVCGPGLFICASMSLCVRAYVQWCWCVYMRVRVCASAYVCRCADMHPDRCAGDLYGKTGAGLA